jgi:hypothetical protein
MRFAKTSPALEIVYFSSQPLNECRSSTREVRSPGASTNFGRPFQVHFQILI